MARSTRPELISLLTASEPVVSKEGCLRAGRPEGVWRGYAEDGTLAVQCTYVRGVRHGRWIKWGRTGERAVEVRYFRGPAQEVRAGYEDGSPALRARLENDELTPGWQAWRPDGRQLQARPQAPMPWADASTNRPDPAPNRPETIEAIGERVS